MATTYFLQTVNQSGTLSAIAIALGNAGVNIESCTGTTYENGGWVSLYTSNYEVTTSVLNDLGVNYTTLTTEYPSNYVTVTLNNVPGALGTMLTEIASQELNISSIHAAGSNVTFETDNIGSALQIAGKYGHAWNGTTAAATTKA